MQQPLNRKPHTTVGDIIGELDLPDPTLEVPFEKFAHLKDSEDMLHRAAFWTFYAAWQLDHDPTQTRQVVANGGQRAPHPLAVEARHDGHQLHAISQQLAIRDCVMIQRAELHALEQRISDGHGTRWAMGSFLLGLGMVIGVLVMLLAYYGVF